MRVSRRSVLPWIMSVSAILLGLTLTSSPAHAAKIEIEVWHRWTGAQQEVLREVLKGFEAKQADIAVKDVSVSGEYVDLMQKILARYAAKQVPPDVLLPGYNFFSYTIQELHPTPIDEIAGAEAKSVYARYSPSVLKIGQSAGKQYGLPFALSAAVLYLNPKLIEAAGLNVQTPPTTWAEVQVWGETIKKKTGKSALYISNPDTFLMQTLIESAGGQFLQDGCPKFNSPEGVAAMEMWRKSYQDGLIPRITYRQLEQSFTAGEVAMVATSIMHLRSWTQQAQFPVRTSILPRFGEKPLRAAGGGAALMVLAQAKERQKAAWELLKYMASEEAMRIWIKTGYLNPLQASLPQIEGQGPAYAAVPNLVGWVSWPGSRGLEVDNRMLNWRDKILFGEVGTKEGLDKAVAEVAPLLPGCPR
jgi:multiple sugar transport system substrate-binding protein